MIRAKKAKEGKCLSCGNRNDVFQINAWNQSRPHGRTYAGFKLCRECIGRLMMQCDLQLIQEEFVERRRNV